MKRTSLPLLSPYGTLLASAEAASCPQLAEGDIGALAERSEFISDTVRSEGAPLLGHYPAKAKECRQRLHS